MHQQNRASFLAPTAHLQCSAPTDPRAPVRLGFLYFSIYRAPVIVCCPTWLVWSVPQPNCSSALFLVRSACGILRYADKSSTTRLSVTSPTTQLGPCLCPPAPVSPSSSSCHRRLFHFLCSIFQYYLIPLLIVHLSSPNILNLYKKLPAAHRTPLRRFTAAAISPTSSPS